MPFGHDGVVLPVLAGSTVIRPAAEAAVPDVTAAVVTALRAPIAGPAIAELVRPGDSVAISVCDGTRAHPRREVLTPLLDELDRVAPGCRVTLVIATGSHRASGAEELRRMLGADLLRRCAVVNHDSRDESALVDLGMVGDVRLWLNRHWVEADVRLTAGVVEPHFFAGFSGGPKMVAPGLAGLPTIMALHSPARIGDEHSVWGVQDGNPVAEAVRRCATRMPPHLALDVRVDRRIRVCDVAAGELFAVHRQLCDRALGTVMVPVDDTFDVVVTTNGGYPLDQNLYQAVKGLAAAERIIHDGSTIVLLAECSDGLPEGSAFGRLLGEVSSVETLLERLDGTRAPEPEQWQVQILARILRRARVFLHCRGLSDAAVRSALLEPCPDPAAAVAAAAAALGPGATVAYLPAGPYAVPYRASPLVPAG